MNAFKKAYDIRYFIFLVALILFLILPSLFQEPYRSTMIFPLLQTVLLLAGIILLQNIRFGIWYIGLLAGLAIVLKWLALNTNFQFFDTPSMALNVLFLFLVGYEIFYNLLKAKQVTPHSIIGAFNGYILLGMTGFFIFLILESIYPGSFGNISSEYSKYEDLIYFSFITLTTIGYGDILPLTGAAKKLSVLLGLVGHFYIAVVMAVLIGKFLRK